MAYHQPFQITGFHSCDKEVGLKILNGQDQLIASENAWDWLGPGVYFWEQNPQRALHYSEECARKKQKNNGLIETPFVIGAIIELGNCLNLIEPNSIGIVKQAYEELSEMCKQTGQQMPVNKGPNRELDCSVIKFVHQSNTALDRPAFDSIRSPFHEGGYLYEGSNFTERLHIEICVLNPDLIKGYFLPRPIDEFNPYLNKPFEKKSI